MKRITSFKSKYAVWDEVLFYNYTSTECGKVRQGRKVNKKPERGVISAVMFDANNEPMYAIQCEGKSKYFRFIMSHMNVSEEHIIELIKE